MPGGPWALDRDASPSGSSVLNVEACGTNGFGLHAKGSGFLVWGAGVSAALSSQGRPVDASRYRGLSFVVRSVSLTPLLLKLQNPYSVPACGKCDDANMDFADDCFSGYVKGLLTTTDAAPTVVQWTDLTQQSWGYRPPGTAMFDAANVVSIAFFFDKGVDFDVCIDDVKLVP
jgi:hypothetical protein